MALKAHHTNSAHFDFEDCGEETVSMLDLKIDTGHSSISFGSQPLSCPSSCPSTTGSFSSASSLYDPFTPTSRTSTPPQPINYDPSSCEDECIMFQLTPPPSATSTYFPMELKPTVAPNMLTHGLPTTPSRCNNLFDNTLSLQGALEFTTPTQDIDAYHGLPDTLGASPFMIPTPPPQFGGPGHNSATPSCDLTSMWGSHSDGSPITFSSPAVSLATPSAQLGSSYGNMRRRVAMDGPQQTSAMLQQHLQDTPTKIRTPRSRSMQQRSGGQTTQRAHRVTKNMERIPPRKYKCDECNGKVYSRAEHLKRHKSEVHVENPTKWVCDFCVPKPKVFGRCDNFRDHLKRHVQKSTGSRTKAQPGAAALLAKMQSEMKTKKRRVPEQAEDHPPSALSPHKDVKVEPTCTPLYSPLP